MLKMLRKEMRKSISTLVCIGILVSFSCSVSAADTTKATNVNKISALIEDNDEYIASNYGSMLDSVTNLSDSSANVSPYPVFITSSDHNSEFIYGEYLLQNEDLLPAKENRTGLYAFTKGFVVTSRNGSKTEDGYDSTTSVRGYVTIYYNTTTIDGLLYYCLTEVTGGYEILDSTVQITSQSVTYGMTGISQQSGSIQKSNTYKPTSSSWSVSTGYTDYVYPTGYGTIGANYTINLKRGSANNWSCTIMNHL